MQIAFNFNPVLEAEKKSKDVDVVEDAIEPWTDQEIWLLNYKVLEDALELAGSKRASKEKRMEAIKWLQAPDWRWVCGRRVHATRIPFSFQSVCKVIGYQPDLVLAQLSEIEEVRDLIEA